MAFKNPFGNAGSSAVSGGDSESWAKKCLRICGAAWPVEKSLWIIALLIIIAGLGKLALGYGFLPGFDFPAASSDKWQAVFLVNNQVYFGHIKSYNKGYVVLKDVYYLQVTQQLQPPSGQPLLNLIKLGSELHGPEDIMFIPKDRILFWENMKPDAQVVKAIESTRK